VTPDNLMGPSLELLFLWILLSVLNILKKNSELCLEILKNANEAHYALLPLIKGQSVFRAEKIKIYKTLLRPVATYRAESWTLLKDIDKQLDTFKENIKINVCGNERKWRLQKTI